MTRNSLKLQNTGLRTQYPYGGEPTPGLTPRPLYDFPSPSSNYPSYMAGASPAFDGMAAEKTPRYGNDAFIPPADVFAASTPSATAMTPQERKQRASEVLNSDPVAVHLLVETAIDDSQNYEILSVDELEALKKEQQALLPRVEALRKKLERETKVKNAAANLHRLSSKEGHKRTLSSRSRNSGSDTTFARSSEELNASTKKCEELSRELFEAESRAGFIQMRLLMHTAGILQLTHNGPSKRTQSSQLPNSVGQRPDSPQSLYTYEASRNGRGKPDDSFDERSLYRSAENLDGLMEALKNGTHHHTSQPSTQQNQALSNVEKRLEELNDRLRALIIQANPDRYRDYSVAPKSSQMSDHSVIEQQLDYLDHGLRDIDAEQANLKNTSSQSLNAVEGRLEGINGQLFGLLSRAQSFATEKVLPPPPGGAEDQLGYIEQGLASIEQIQYAMSEDIEELQSKPAVNNQDSQYETTLLGLWSIMQAGEEQARQRKAERRRLLASEPDADEELSPDEDVGPAEEFSLGAFSTKVQFLYSRASSLKEKESILRRQIKQQRELNSRSDAQKETEFARLKDLLEKARMEKASAEEDLERAVSQLRQFDEQNKNAQSEALRNVQAQSQALEEDCKQASQRCQMLEDELDDANQRCQMLEADLKDAQDKWQFFEAQVKDARDAEERSQALEAQLREAQDDARIEAAEVKAELSESLAKIETLNQMLRAAATEKEAAEARAVEATNALNAKEEELRELEGEVVRLTTELTFAKAELDGAYGSRAERAAEVAANPTIKKELDDLSAKNAILLAEVESLRKAQEAASQSETQARETEHMLKQELSAMTADYEILTRESIQNEKERDNYEALIDALRDEKEKLEMELSDEKVRWLGVRSPGSANGQPPAMEATSIRMLREDFRKMMRERTAEGLRALRNEQEERRKLEATIRTLKKESGPQKSSLSKTMTA